MTTHALCNVPILSMLTMLQRNALLLVPILTSTTLKSTIAIYAQLLAARAQASMPALLARQASSFKTEYASLVALLFTMRTQTMEDVWFPKNALLTSVKTVPINACQTATLVNTRTQMLIDAMPVLPRA